jgi:hypothetical protein
MKRASKPVCRPLLSRVTRLARDQWGAGRFGSLNGSDEKEASILADQITTGPAGREVSRQSTRTKRHAVNGVRNPFQRLLRRLLGRGQPLPEADRFRFEQRFGHDLSQVRLHSGTAASKITDAMRARAVTAGNDVVLGHGELAPSTRTGRWVLAHELAHVVQQQRQPEAAQVQPLLRVLNPGTRPTYLPDPDRNKTRGTLVTEWLGQLCSSAEIAVQPDGQVNLTNSSALCPLQTAGASGTPSSCACVCRYTDPATPQVDIAVQERFPFYHFRPDSTSGINRLETDPGDVGRAGGGFTLFPDNVWLNDTTVVLSGRTRYVRGRGDTNPAARSRGLVRDPPWIILAHELCGHVTTQGPNDYFHTETRQGNLSAVDIENRIRREHSTVGAGYGTRIGDSTLYVVTAGETLDSISFRVGLPGEASPRVWNRHDEHTHITVWPSIDPVLRNDVASAVIPGRELLIRGIHWHEVIANETWARIAADWGKRVSSLRRANPGVSNLQAGMRLLIPIR